jgi:ketosteroid isomerase-like protein
LRWHRQSVPPTNDRAEIRALWDRASRALCAGDWEGYQELWAPTDYIEVIHPQEADWRVGWDAIGPAYRSLVDSGFRCESETRLMRIHLSPAREMAWATAEVVIRAADPPMERTLWQTLVFEKIQGHWRLVHGHASVPQPPA